MVKQRSSDLHRGFKLSRCELRLARQISSRVASCCTCCASWIFLDATHNMSTAVRSHEAHTSIRSRAARVKHLPPGPAKRRQVDGNDKASVKAVLATPWAVQWGEAEGEGFSSRVFWVGDRPLHPPSVLTSCLQLCDLVHKSLTSKVLRSLGLRCF